MATPSKKPMTNLTAVQALAVARAVAIEKMPYFQVGILELRPRFVPGYGTLGVSRTGILCIDPDVIRSWTPEQAGSVILHEYMHPFLRHEDRAEKLLKAGVVQNTPEMQKLLNKTMDGEINDDLLAAGCDLPSFTRDDGTVIPPITPEGEGWPPNRLFEEYLKIELDKLRNQPPQPPSNGQGQDPQGHQGGPGSGHCGGCAHHPHPNEPPADDADGQAPVDQDITRKQVIQAMKSAKERGNLPAGLARFVEEETKPAQVPWQTKLSRAARKAVTFKNGQGDYTYRRRSRRQGAFEGWKDAPVLPGVHQPKAEVAFAADSSGSMGADELAIIVREVKGVIQNLAGSQVSFFSCDTEVHGLVRTRDIATIKKSFKGGGGTDFRPVFKQLEELKPRPDVFIFATDGMGSYPDGPPQGVHVIWLNINGRIEVEWGEVIDVAPTEDA